MEKKKTIEQSGLHKGSPMEGVQERGVYGGMRGGFNLRKRTKGMERV